MMSLTSLIIKLHDVYESLYNEYKNSCHKYNSLEKSHACLLVEKDVLENKACIIIDSDKVNQLEKENKALKEKSGQVEYHISKVHSRF